MVEDRRYKDAKDLYHLVSPQDVFICIRLLLVGLHLLRPSLHQVVNVVVALQKLIVARLPIFEVMFPRVGLCNKLRHATAEALVDLPRQAAVLLSQSGILLSEC